VAAAGVRGGGCRRVFLHALHSARAKLSAVALVLLFGDAVRRGHLFDCVPVQVPAVRHPAETTGAMKQNTVSWLLLVVMAVFFLIYLAATAPATVTWR
jgi:hypothetical protein